MTVEKYWTQKYGSLRYSWLPCLDVSKGKRVNYLPMEVCEVAPGQRILKLSDELTRNIIRFTAVKPEERREQIRLALQQAGVAQDPAARAFKIQIDQRMIQVCSFPRRCDWFGNCGDSSGARQDSPAATSSVPDTALLRHGRQGSMELGERSISETWNDQIVVSGLVHGQRDGRSRRPS